MKVNTDKSHLLLSGNTKLASSIDNKTAESEMKQESLGITTDSKLSFEEHVNNICKKASQKLNALARISSDTFFLGNTSLRNMRLKMSKP